MTVFSAEAATVVTDAAELASQWQLPVSPALVFYAAICFAERSQCAVLQPPERKAAIAGLVKAARIPEATAIALLREMTERAYASAFADQGADVSFKHVVTAAAATIEVPLNDALQPAGVSLETILSRLETISGTLRCPQSSAASPSYSTSAEQV